MKQRAINAVNKTLEAISVIGLATFGLAVAYAILGWWVLPIMIALFVIYYHE